MSRLTEVLKLVREILGEHEPIIEVIEHSLRDDREYLNIKMTIERKNAVIMIREYVREGNIVAYGYYFRTAGHEELWTIGRTIGRCPLTQIISMLMEKSSH